MRSFSHTDFVFRNRSGVTLLEVLITLVLTALLFAILYSALFLTSRSQWGLRSRMRREEQLTRVYAQMRLQLLNLYSSPHPLAPQALRIAPAVHEKRKEFIFLTSSLSSDRGVGMVGYRIQEDQEGRPYLAYKELAFPKEEFFDSVPWTVLSESISGLLVKAQTEEDLASGKYREEWNEPFLPARIEVTLLYPSSGEEGIFSFKVAPGLLSWEKGLGP
ncbi:MAG: prepilin-type N-terminal cleavage/methylation domain-containing protein [Armatimonadetes bacterium]|nr:prepilin-type N-terminal cleavage/methylation domain-containing protein [Armatimonadota bacterium]